LRWLSYGLEKRAMKGRLRAAILETARAAFVQTGMTATLPKSLASR